MKTRIIQYSIMCVIVTLVLSSCIYDDRSNCPPETTTFRFSYKYRGQSDINEFPSAVKGVRLYIFDADSLFVEMVRTDLPEGTEHDTFTLSCDLPQGKYNVVTLAGERNDSLYHYVKRSNHKFENIEFVKGKTTLSEVLFYLGQDPTTLQAPNAGSPFTSESYLNLYHNLKKGVDIQPGTTEIPVALTKITHDIDITVNDLRTKPDIDQFAVRGSLYNEAIDFKRQIYPEASKVRYLPYETTDGKQKNLRTFTLSSMRMTPDMAGDLVLTDTQTGKEIIREALISDILEQHPDIAGDPNALDKYSRFQIGIEISDGEKVAISVTLNNWKVYVVHTDM